MNIVTQVRYQNFLAAGNAPIEVNLCEHPTTLVIGKNGAGKSTLHEAICFAWFGRPLRKITKPSLVNWINLRDCLVELEWHHLNGTKYMVRRGIKPAIFEIYKNGTLEPIPSNIDHYQAQLETIIKLNHKSFMQVVVLGGSAYVPFMRLTSSTRREIIEDLLDIEVFSSMNALAKEDLTEVKSALDKNATTRTLLAEQVKMAETFEAHIDLQIKERLESIQVAVDDTNQTIVDLLAERAEHVEALKPFESVKDKQSAATAKLSEYAKTQDRLRTRLTQATKEREFYEENDTCPTCEQSITDEFKTGRFDKLVNTTSTLDKASTQCAGLIAKYRAAEQKAREALEGATSIQAAINTIDAKVPLHRKRLRELEDEKARVSKPKVSAPAVDKEALISQLAGLQDQHTDLSTERVILDAATMLLKDNGIKTRIIKHYLPVINKAINHYLNAMDFPIGFTFDEGFDEHIKTHHGDSFAYEQFSDGEKKRIDLALLLTWRSVARLKNSAATNLLVLDEVFDGSLDAAGMEEFLKIIHNLESDVNVFVMSHRIDQLTDKFAHTLTYEKVRGFSQIKVRP